MCIRDRWYQGRTIYESCARINNTDNGDVLYIAASTNFPYLTIEFNSGVYTFDSDNKREHVERILIKTSSQDEDISIPLRGPIESAAVTAPLAIALNQGANWIGSNVYEVGQTVIAKTAAFTGGVDPVTYRFRFQTRATTSDSWTAEPWTTTTNAKNDASLTLSSTGQIKFQSQAKDVNGNLFSNTAVKTVT